MSELQAIVFGVWVGVWITLGLQQSPRFMKWLKYKIWYNLRYAEGYRKGLADGRNIARRELGE